MRKILVFVLLVLAMNSCKPEPADSEYDYIIINNSSYHVNLNIFYLNYDSVPKDSLLALSSNAEIKNHHINYNPGNAFSLPVDSVFLIFDNTKRLVYRKDDGQLRNILDINNYTGGKVNDYWYKYQYIITNEDYFNASEIK